jgi:hypothetical protein
MANDRIHEGARPGIEARGLELLLRIREDPEPASPEPTFRSERPPAATFTDADMLGSPRMWKTDIAGRKTAAVFWRDHKGFGLFDTDYKELRGLVELISKSPWIRSRVSTEFLEDVLFDWCEVNYGKESRSSLCDFVISECTKVIRQLTVWVPIAHLETEVALPIGPVRIESIRQSWIDRMRDQILRKRPDDKAEIEQGFEKLRSRIQGRAAVVVPNIEAEPDHAFNIAIELADSAIGLLRIFSAAHLSPWCTCSTAILGSEAVPAGIALLMEAEDQLSQQISKILVNAGQAADWQITQQLFDGLLKENLPELGNLVTTEGLSDFQTVLRSSLLTFSKGLTLADVNDRLVHTLSALEGLLLKDASEPIQQNLADRMAFTLYSDPQSRMDAAQNVKIVYGMRSRYIHHRKSLRDEAELERFTINSGLFLTHTLKVARTYNTKADFISAIDKRKYGH